MLRREKHQELLGPFDWDKRKMIKYGCILCKDLKLLTASKWHSTFILLKHKFSCSSFSIKSFSILFNSKLNSIENFFNILSQVFTAVSYIIPQDEENPLQTQKKIQKPITHSIPDRKSSFGLLHKLWKGKILCFFVHFNEPLLI